MTNILMRLEKIAEKTIRDFHKNYRTIRNPYGKQFIVVYGGCETQREELVSRIKSKLDVDAFVFDSPFEVEDERALNINLDYNYPQQS